jgi:DNA-binding MarR family transcriptional regulator
MIFMFDGRLAIHIGLSEAIVLTYFSQRPKSLQDSVYPSKSALWMDLPFGSEATVNRAIKRLEKAGYINIIPSDTTKNGFKVILTAQGIGALNNPLSAYIEE